jgi:hypothetical protein
MENFLYDLGITPYRVKKLLRIENIEDMQRLEFLQRRFYYFSIYNLGKPKLLLNQFDVYSIKTIREVEAPEELLWEAINECSSGIGEKPINKSLADWIALNIINIIEPAKAS